MREIRVKNWENSVIGNAVVAWCEVCGILYRNILGEKKVDLEVIEARKQTARNHINQERFTDHNVEVRVYKRLPSRAEIVGRATMRRFREGRRRIG